MALNEQAASMEGDSLVSRNVYSLKERVHGPFDSVVLPCGSVPEPSLYEEVRGTPDDVHILVDAYSPRRLVFATRHAHALARQLLGAG